jgi:hypothetical protein
VPPTERRPTPDTLDPPARDFVLWLLDALGLMVQAGEDGVYEIAVPAVDSALPDAVHPYAAMAGRRFVFEAGEQPDVVEQVTWQSPLVQWLIDQLQGGTRLLQAAAAEQPLTVHELAEHLFAQYQIDQGHMHLAGCSLEDRPFLRLSYLQSAHDDARTELVHCFGTDEGELLEAALRKDLHLDKLTPVSGRTPRIDPQLVQRWSELIGRQFEAQQTVDLHRQLVAVTLVWCKHADGKLTFSIGRQTVEVPFSGWGQMLAARRSLPPPYDCPLSGRSSYHLAATDDGRITVAEAIATCAVSSRRVLDSELNECAVTHRKVLPEYLQQCPCTSEQVLRSVLEMCSMCQQMVSPRALVEGRCCACRRLQAVARQNAQWQPVWDAYPGLKKLRHPRAAETETAWILVGNLTWRRLLVVLQKTDTSVLHLATSGRLSKKWTPVPDDQRDSWLGTPDRD